MCCVAVLVPASFPSFKAPACCAQMMAVYTRNPGQRDMALGLTELLENSGSLSEELKQTLLTGQQTDGDQHQTLSQALRLRLHVHHCSEVCVEAEVLGCAEGSEKELHVQLRRAADGDGACQGHFDFLRDRKHKQAEPSDGVPTPETIQHCLTVSGLNLLEAMLSGYKDCENRRFSMEKQWVALHCGKTASSHSDDIARFCPGLASQVGASAPGLVCGMVFFSKSLKMEEHREEAGCGPSCVLDTKTFSATHVPTCRCSPFAYGPVLNVISRAIKFNVPFPAKGKLGKWPLESRDRHRILAILQAGEYTLRVFDPATIQTWPLPWLPPNTPRHAAVPVETCTRLGQTFSSFS